MTMGTSGVKAGLCALLIVWMNVVNALAAASWFCSQVCVRVCLCLCRGGSGTKEGLLACPNLGVAAVAEGGAEHICDLVDVAVELPAEDRRHGAGVGMGNRRDGTAHYDYDNGTIHSDDNGTIHYDHDNGTAPV